MSIENAVFWGVIPSVLIRTNVSEESIVFMIKVKRISELVTTLAVISN
jgi:hypothetical protein